MDWLLLLIILLYACTNGFSVLVCNINVYIIACQIMR